MATLWRLIAMLFHWRLRAPRVLALPMVLAAVVVLAACSMSALPPQEANAAPQYRPSRTPVLTIAYTADSKGYFDPCPT